MGDGHSAYRKISSSTCEGASAYGSADLGKTPLLFGVDNGLVALAMSFLILGGESLFFEVALTWCGCFVLTD